MTTDAAEEYYQGFSYSVGRGDWLRPNPRHEQLKLLVGATLRGRRGLRILDVGCGAGVMSAWLGRFGAVTATDFSRPAVELGRVLAPAVDFRVGRLEELRSDEPYDLITAFDVLEHVPRDERPALFELLGELSAPHAMLIVSTPHPRFSNWMDEERPDLKQVVDEAVELTDLLELAAATGLELVRYETFDVNWRRQYQFAVFERLAEVGAQPRMRRTLRARLALVGNPVTRALRRRRVSRRLRSHPGGSTDE